MDGPVMDGPVMDVPVMDVPVMHVPVLRAIPVLRAVPAWCTPGCGHAGTPLYMAHMTVLTVRPWTSGTVY